MISDKLHLKKSHGVAVNLRKLLVLPLCIDIENKCNLLLRDKGQIYIEMSKVDSKCKIWADQILIQEAILSLLGHALQFASKKQISLSFCCSEMQGLDITVAFRQHLSHGRSETPALVSERTSQILQQHQCRTETNSIEGMHTYKIRIPCL